MGSEARQRASSSSRAVPVGIASARSWAYSAIPTGTARLLELARCLASDPKLLLLDEPSSGLSEVETHALGELLRELADEGCAVLMVEHDMGLVMAVCHTIRVLDFGKVIATGSPAEVRGDPRVQQAYLGYSDDDTGEPEPTISMPAVPAVPAMSVGSVDEGATP